MEELEETVLAFRLFLDAVNGEERRQFAFSGGEDDYLVCRGESTTLIGEDDFEAEVLDWALRYLIKLNCPPFLSSAISRSVLLEMKTLNLDEILHSTSPDDPIAKAYDPFKLWLVVMEKLQEKCQQWQEASDGELSTLVGKRDSISVCAIKNGRRKMEDRHVVIEDLNSLFGLQGHPPTSFYAVFDGHAGTDAACYSSVHLHYNVVHHPSYPYDIEKALKEGFTNTDKNFISKSDREGLKSGSTALCCLLRDRKLYFAWLGDSQAIIARGGVPVNVMSPHKPDRADERDRIENLGGIVLHFGTWRVNGTLAVSRAIGDAEYKPYVSSDPDVAVLDLEGNEDFIVLACDGLWDVLQDTEVVERVYSHLAQNPSDTNGVSGKLVQVAKEKGSSDNITVVTVFLRDVKDMCVNANLERLAAMKNAINETVAPIKVSAAFNGNPFVDSPDLETFGNEPVEFQTAAPQLNLEASSNGDKPDTPNFSKDFISDWDASGFQQQLLQREVGQAFLADSQQLGGVDYNREEEFLQKPGDIEQLGNPFGDPSVYQPAYNFELSNAATGNYFEFQVDAGVDSGTAVNWSDGLGDAMGSVGQAYGQPPDHVIVGNPDFYSKPFESNLSPDAEPFVMGHHVSAPAPTYSEDDNVLGVEELQNPDVDVMQPSVGTGTMEGTDLLSDRLAGMPVGDGTLISSFKDEISGQTDVTGAGDTSNFYLQEQQEPAGEVPTAPPAEDNSEVASSIVVDVVPGVLEVPEAAATPESPQSVVDVPIDCIPAVNLHQEMALFNEAVALEAQPPTVTELPDVLQEVGAEEVAYPDSRILGEELIVEPVECTLSATTNSETVISELKFEYTENSEVPAGTLSREVQNQFMEPQTKEDPTVVELAVSSEKIPDSAPVAEDVEDDESEDGEEWKFYRNEASDTKEAAQLKGTAVADPCLQIPGPSDEESIITNSLQTPAPLVPDHSSSLSEGEFQRLESSAEDGQVLVFAQPAIEVPKAEVAPPTAPVKVETKAKAAAKPKAAPAKPTSTRPAAASTKTTAAPPARKPLPTKPAAKPSADAAKRPPTGTTNKPMAAASRTAKVADGAPAETKKTSATTRQPAAKSTLPSSTVAAAARTAENAASNVTARKKPVAASATASSASAAAKVSKEQSNVRSKPSTTATPVNGHAKETEKPKAASAANVPRRAPAAAASVTARLAAPKPQGSAQPKKEVAPRSQAAARVPASKMDVKQTKETVNKQISGTMRRVTAPTTSSLAKAESSKTSTLAKSPQAANGNKGSEEAANKLVTSTPKVKVAAATKTPAGRPASSAATRSPPANKTPSATKEKAATPKSMLKSSPLPRSSGKAATKSPVSKKQPVTTSQSSSPAVKNLVNEDAGHEKGILDASSKEAAIHPKNNDADAVPESELQPEMVTTAAANGSGDSDVPAVNGQHTLQLQDAGDLLLI